MTEVSIVVDRVVVHLPRGAAAHASQVGHAVAAALERRLGAMTWPDHDVSVHRARMDTARVRSAVVESALDLAHHAVGAIETQLRGLLDR
jgi:hypothetical protein